MPRFVILEHDHPGLHWDLMLEDGEVLRTWRLSGPLTEGSPVGAERSFDHRLVYLDYEGPISGGRGRVARWDFGTFVWERQKDQQVVVALNGGRLRGRLRLEAGQGGWLALFQGESV